MRFNPDNGHWYRRYIQYSGIRESWNDISAFAELQGGYLATLTSQQEQDFVYANFVSGSPSIDHDSLGGYSTYLTGGFLGSDNQWKWVTGEPFVYTNWHPGEPNGQSVIVISNVVSNVNWNGKWGDEFKVYADYGVQNPYTLGFIVEWNSDPNLPAP